MKPKCYYHKSDFDGKCSAAIVRRKYPECELIGVDYPDKPDFENIDTGDTVLVVDFSFEPDDMKKLRKITQGNLIWIDHHKSALIKNEFKGIDWFYKGKREIDKAACELTWEYLFPDEPMPKAVKLLGRYDVWEHSDELVLPFQYGMRLEKWDPSNSELFRAWPRLLAQDWWCENIIKKGRNIIQYETQRNKIYAEEMAFPVEFEGYDALAINKTLSNSKIFETIENSNKRPLWILFSYRAGIWKYSLYCAPGIGLDVSEIAVKYGGGGHAGAAGFQSKKYLLKEVS